MWNLIFVLFIVLGGVILSLYGLCFLGAKFYRLIVVKSDYSPASRRMCFLSCALFFAIGMWLVCDAGNSGGINLIALALGGCLCAFHCGGAFGTFLTY
jgi:hypothetical protein